MIISEVKNLADLIFMLAGRKVEINKHYYSQYVEPVWLLLFDLHSNYKESLIQYIALVKDRDMKIDNIIQIIYQDAVFMADLRVKLRAAIENFARVPTGSNGDRLRNQVVDFIEAVSDYFEVRIDTTTLSENSTADVFLRELADEYRTNYTEYTLQDLLFNEVRFAAIQTIEENSPVLGREELSGLLVYIMRDLQIRFSKVANAFHSIRTVFIG